MGIERKNILLIDDSEDARIVVKKILEAQGCSVYEADSVDSGIEQSHIVCPHLILLDLKMPGKSGFEFLKTRIYDSKIRSVPVIVASRIKEKSLVSHAIALKADGYILKPFDTKLVLQKVRKHLKDNSFFRYKFDKSENRPTVQIQTHGVITHVHDGGMRFKAPLRLKENSRIKIESQLLKNLDIQDKGFSTAPYPSFLDDDRQYESKILFAGLTSEEAKQVRNKIKGLK